MKISVSSLVFTLLKGSSNGQKEGHVEEGNHLLVHLHLDCEAVGLENVAYLLLQPNPNPNFVFCSKKVQIFICKNNIKTYKHRQITVRSERFDVKYKKKVLVRSSKCLVSSLVCKWVPRETV